MREEGGREEQVLSSDEEVPVITRPRQRSLRRRRSSQLTNRPTSQQLVLHYPLSLSLSLSYVDT